MNKLKYTFTIREFLSLNSATELTKFEEVIQNYIKPNLMQRLLNEQGNKNEFILKFKREYWDEKRINNQCNEEFYFPPYNPDKPNDKLTYSELIEQIKTSKPFDLVLVSMTKDEYLEELKLEQKLEDFYGIKLDNINDEEKFELLQKMRIYNSAL